MVFELRPYHVARVLTVLFAVPALWIFSVESDDNHGIRPDDGTGLVQQRLRVATRWQYRMDHPRSRIRYRGLAPFKEPRSMARRHQSAVAAVQTRPRPQRTQTALALDRPPAPRGPREVLA